MPIKDKVASGTVHGVFFLSELNSAIRNLL